MKPNENKLLKFLEEVTAGADHEINNLLLMIEGSASLLLDSQTKTSEKEDALLTLSEKVNRIHLIMNELRTVIRDGHNDPFEPVSLKSVCDKILDLCKARYKNHKIFFNVEVNEELTFKGRETEIIQAVLGVLNFCHNRIGLQKQRWIKLNVFEINSELYIDIEDSGETFKTLELEGAPLSMSRSIVEDNFGSLNLLNENNLPLIRIVFPKLINQKEEASLKTA